MKLLATLLLSLTCLCATAQEGDEFAYATTSNRSTTPDSWFLYFADGRAVVKRDSLYGFVDRQGVEVIPCRYTKAYCFNDGIALVRDGYQNYAIDTMGRRLAHKIEFPRLFNRDFSYFISATWRRIPFISSDEPERLKNTVINAIVTISADGTITACEPAEEYSDTSSSELFERIHKVVMTSAKWSPARVDGEPRAVRYLLPIEFGKIRAPKCWPIDEMGKRIEKDFVYPLFQVKSGVNLNDWLYKQMRFRTSEEYQRAQKGMVRVFFTIDTKGAVCDIEVLRSHNEVNRNKLVEVLQKSPRWRPATIDGKAVAVRYDLSYYFNFR